MKKTEDPTPSTIKDFANPGAEFRGAPFWAWNGKLDPETCRRQIRQMRDGGLGGFFMHSRTGLNTPYLSKEWFDCIDACVDEAKKLKMRAWLYDEDRWPSGAAGGLVTKDPRFRARSLRLHVCRDGLAPTAFGASAGAKITAALCRENKVVAVFTARIDGKVASHVRFVPSGRDPAPADGEAVVVAVVETDPTSSWYNGTTYLDTLSAEAVKRFIEVTHEAYARDLGDDLGGAVPGIFTDEPNHKPPVQPAVINADGKVPDNPLIAWTGKLPAAFRRLAGYRLEPHLLELVYDVEGVDSRKLRYDFNNCLTSLFVENFVKQIGDWCGKHGCAFTGHMLAEDLLESQTSTVGSCIRCYEYMQAPGMDMLTEKWRIFPTAKQVSSAAHQFGRKWRLTETYGTTGWDFPFAGHKALGDWQAALGINLRCQHLAWYTMLAQAKRDYPASIFYQSPWWPYYGKVEDYFARVNATMASGEEVRDILFVHPVESAWTLTSAGWASGNADLDELNGSYLSLTDWLLASHLDFDYGDEDILARHGKVSGGRIVVGKAAYKAVVLPSMLTLRSSTLALLKRFAKAGGLVVFAGRIPALVDAVPSESAAAFAATCAGAEALERGAALDRLCRRVSVADAATGDEFGPALYLLREDADNRYLFVCNTGETFCAADRPAADPATAAQPQASATRRFRWSVHPKSSALPLFGGLCRDRKAACDDAVVSVAGPAAAVYALDPETGAIGQANAVATADGCAIRTSLPPLGSRLFVIAKKAAKGAPALPKGATPPPLPRREVASEAPLAKRFEPRLSEANVLVLDTPEYRIGDGEWEKPLEILRIDKKVRARLGLEERQGHMFQPWTIAPKADPKAVELSLRYRFDVDAVPSGDFFVALERPECFRLAINGEEVPVSGDCGWWTDTSMRKIRVDPAVLRKGGNVLEAAIRYTENFSGLEIVYLLGNFGAEVRGVGRAAIVAMPSKVKAGDLCGQGFPFYAGNFGYCAPATPVFAKGQRVVVKCGGFRGAAARVLVDGRTAGIAAWPPFEVDVTDFVESGRESEIVVEVLGSRRNSHGSLHWHEQWPAWQGPNTFAFYDNAPELWKDAYNLVPFGFLAAPSLAIVKG